MENFLKSVLRSKKGSAAVTVSLAVGVLGGIAVMMMKSNEDATKAMKTNFLTEDMESMASQIQRLLSSSAACTATFNTLNAKSSPLVTEVKDHTGLVVINTDTHFGTTNVGIDSVQLLDPNDSADDVNVVTGGIGTTFAVISFKKMDKSSFQERNKVMRLRLRVETNGSDQVVRCFTLNSSDTLWTREAPSDNINYAAGNVGIGLNTPTEKMDVSGASYTVPQALAVAAETSAGKKFSMGGSATEYQFNIDDNLPLVFKERSGTTLAKAIVKNAVADQSIILSPVLGSPSAVPCNSGIEGAMRMKEIFIRAQAHGQSALTLLRTQVCSDFGGLWKWRTVKLQRFTRATGTPCTPGTAQKDCTDHNTNSPHQ
ncbi:MAG: hypothetical protein V4598_02610 [Bdellovibrionota bacterium]